MPIKKLFEFILTLLALHLICAQTLEDLAVTQLWLLRHRAAEGVVV